MKECKHNQVQIEEGPDNRLVRFNRDDASLYGLENWEVNDQEEIERNESSEDDKEVNWIIFSNLCNFQVNTRYRYVLR